ncbi:hypothetical protein [Micromonospora sp. LOL_023]|uniref:hypothetical protein n=1 Tax=Micromonospora sp. LOL_023 TaxID=3345418 RepID=UPI003A871F43
MSCYPSMVESGAFVSPDPNAAVPGWVRDAPRIPGIVRVYFDHDALGALSLIDTLMSNRATLDRWVDSPSSDEVRTMTRAAAEERTGKHHLDLDLPGRVDLLDPSDDRVLPIDDRHRIVPVDQATGVRIVPKVHLLDGDPGVRRPSVLPFDGQFPGQLRVQGEMVHLGLPAGLVNNRYPDVSVIPVSTGQMRTASGYPELLGHLNSLPDGSRTSVEVVSADGADTYLAMAVGGPDGPALLQESGGTIGTALLPRQFAGLRHAPLPSAAELSRPRRPGMVLRAGVDGETVRGLLGELRAIALEHGGRVREALVPYADEPAYADAMAGWNSFTTSLLSYDGSTFDRSAHPEQVFGAYESVHDRLAGLDKLTAHPLPPIDETLPAAYFAPVAAADVDKSVNITQFDWLFNPRITVDARTVAIHQRDLTSGREDLLGFLTRVLHTAERVFDDSTPRRRRSSDSQGRIRMFQNAVNAYRILAQGRASYDNLETRAEKRFFNANYRNYLSIYADLGYQFGVLADYARENPGSVAGRGDRVRLNELPGMMYFVHHLPSAEAELFRARRVAAQAVADQQRHLVALNTRRYHDVHHGQVTMRLQERNRDETVVLSLDDPDPSNGRVYSDAEKERIDDARVAILAERYNEWTCGPLVADALVRLNQLLVPAPGSRRGDVLSQIDYGESDHDAGVFDHTAAYIGPAFQPESVIYDPWPNETAITNVADVTVPGVHRYDQTGGYRADGYDWTEVARRYIDWGRLSELDEEPAEHEMADPRDVFDINHASLGYAQNNNLPADRLELSGYGMSATAASRYQPDPANWSESSEGWARRYPPDPIAPEVPDESSDDDTANDPTLPVPRSPNRTPQYAAYPIGEYASVGYGYGAGPSTGLSQTNNYGYESQNWDDDDLVTSDREDEIGGRNGSNSGPPIYMVAVDDSAGFRPSLPGAVGELTSRYDELQALMRRARPALADALDSTDTRPHWETLDSATVPAEVHRQLRDLGFAATRQVFADHGLLVDQILDRLAPAVTADDAPAAAALQDLRGWLGGSGADGGTGLGGSGRRGGTVPEDDWWRLYIDPLHQQPAQMWRPDNPGLYYDHDEEPGFRDSMVEAYRDHLFPAAPIGQIDSGRYHEMHAAVVRHLPGGVDWTGQPNPDGVPDPSLSPVYGPLADSVRELRIDGRPLVSTDRAADPIVLLDTRQEPVFVPNYPADEAPGLVDRILTGHYAAMVAATEPFEKLRTISATIVSLHIGHFHPDGNARVNIDLLLHRLMIDAGFDPVIFPDMNRSFSGHRDIDSLARSLANRQGRPLADHLDMHDGHLTDAEMPPPPLHAALAPWTGDETPARSAPAWVSDGWGNRPAADSDSDSDSDSGLFAQPMDRRVAAEPAALSLTDFLSGASPVSETSARPGAYEVFTAGLHRPDPTAPTLYSATGADQSRAGSLGRDVAELIDAGLAQALAATPDVPALHLPVAEHGGRAMEADVRWLNRTLELFAQAGVLPVVATRGAIDADTAQVLDRYGAVAWHAASGDGADSGGGFRLRRPGSRGRTGQPGGRYAEIDAQAHQSAVSQARPAVVDRAPEPVLEVLLEENPQRQRDLMNDRPELVTSDDFLERVTGMGQRVPNVPAVRLLRPDVRLRRLGLPDAVHGYIATPAMDRPNILLETVGQLHDRGEDTSVLAEMVNAETADVTDGTAGEVQNRDFLADLLDALDQAKAGEFTGAQTTDGEFAGVEAFVDANRHRLTDSDTKYRILDALGTYHQTRSTDAEKAQVQALQIAVSKCL